MFAILLTISSESFSSSNNDWVFDSLSIVAKKQIRASLTYLIERDVSRSVRSLHEKYNIDSSDGQALYDLVFSNFKTIVGESASTKICTQTYSESVPLCGMNSEGLLLTKPSLIYMPNSNFTVWNIGRDMRRYGINNGGLVLSGGGYLEINDSNSMVLIYLSKSINVSGEKLAIKNISEMLGYAISVELIKKDISPFLKCEYLIYEYICQTTPLGYFEPVGDLLLDMSSTCITCNAPDRTQIQYWALNNLSRLDNSDSKKRIVFNTYISIREKIESMGLDISFLESRYRQSLL